MDPGLLPLEIPGQGREWREVERLDVSRIDLLTTHTLPKNHSLSLRGMGDPNTAVT